MSELTLGQQKALDAPEQPPVAIDPRTGQQYLLIRREIYELLRGTLTPYGRGRDVPAGKSWRTAPARVAPGCEQGDG